MLFFVEDLPYCLTKKDFDLNSGSHKKLCHYFCFYLAFLGRKLQRFGENSVKYPGNFREIWEDLRHTSVVPSYRMSFPIRLRVNYGPKPKSLQLKNVNLVGIFRFAAFLTRFLEDLFSGYCSFALEKPKKFLIIPLL